ncbi:unnamed protein product [Sphagnum jensenii]|uniref:Uncharacterized protein n=1 Tax=Sphagnum jensenii TaxID=128206 RepID=A0ABP1BS91_9BRYO
MTHKQVCLLASLQVLGGQDPIYSKSVSPTYLDKNPDSSLATRNPLRASRNGQRREGGTTPNVPTARRKHVTESGCRSRFYNRSGPLEGCPKEREANLGLQWVESFDEEESQGRTFPV